jgi:hypothetical protein
VNGRSGEIVKRDEKKGKRSMMQSWGNFVLDLLKYPFAIILFNLALYLFVRTKMTDGSLELVLRETNPKFF